MKKHLIVIAILAIAIGSYAASGKLEVQANTRDAIIAKATVWSDPGNISKIDIARMYDGNDDVKHEYNQEIRCVFDEASFKEFTTTGMTHKFWCHENGDKSKEPLKVKYGLDNGEVFAEAISTRLLHVLGFYADIMQPVNIKCLNCPAKPWEYISWQSISPKSQFAADHAQRVQRENKRRMGRTILYPEAVIEYKAKGKAVYLNGKLKPGWSYEELDKVDARKGGSSKAEVDALRLLTAFIQHGDSKAEQQRLVCSKKDIVADANGNMTDCKNPRLVVQDIGATLGYSTKDVMGIKMVLDGSKVNLAGWISRPVWKDKVNCVARLSKSFRGTIGDPKISEEGRAFLAHLMAQLTDKQIYDIFKLSRIDMRGDKIEDWVKAFKDKRAEIVNHPGCAK